MTPQETDPDLPGSVRESPVEVWVNSSLVVTVFVCFNSWKGPNFSITFEEQFFSWVGDFCLTVVFCFLFFLLALCVYVLTVLGF